MIFDNDFAKCVTTSQCEQVLDSLKSITAIESRLFLKRAYNKRMDAIKKELAEKAFRESYLAQQEEARKKNRSKIKFGCHFDERSHDAMAQAVADSINPFYIIRPRVWLAKHAGAVGHAAVVPKELKVLFKDYRATVKEFEKKVKAKSTYRENVHGIDLQYSVCL